MSQQIAKKIWLKNTKNNVMYEVLESELSIYQSDKEFVVIASDAEVERYVKGTHWKHIYDNLATDVTSEVKKEEALKSK